MFIKELCKRNKFYANDVLWLLHHGIYTITTIKRDENFGKVVQFYKKNGFIELNDRPNWREICHCKDPSLLALVRVRPITCASVSTHDKEYETCKKLAHQML